MTCPHCNRPRGGCCVISAFMGRAMRLQPYYLREWVRDQLITGLPRDMAPQLEAAIVRAYDVAGFRYELGGGA